MALTIELNEAVANRRTIHFRLFTSNGTSPDIGASNDSLIVARGSNTTFTPDALVTAVHAAQGMYSLQLLQSNVSNLGQHAIYHVQGDFPQHVANVEVVNSNPYSTQSNVDSNVSLWRGTAPNALSAGRVNSLVGSMSPNVITATAIQDGAITAPKIGSACSILLRPTTHTGAIVPTVTDVTNGVIVTTNNDKTGYTILAGTYSTVTFSAGGLASSLVTLASGTHTGAVIPTVTDLTNAVTADTVTDKTGYTIAAGSYSDVTFSTGGTVPSSVTLATGTHTGVVIPTVTAITDPVTAGTVTDKTGYSISGTKTTLDALNDIDGSAVTLVDGGITSAKFAAGAVDAAALATDAGQEIADRMLARNIAGSADGTRDVTSSLRALRNRVETDSSVLTVYQENDTTSAWTASVSTGADPILGINPA